MKKLLFILLVLLIPTLVYAYTETVYVCPDGFGGGSTDGSTKANCWDGFDDIEWDTDDSDDNKLGQNDLLELNDDNGYYRETLTVAESGVSGKPITIGCESGDTCVIRQSEMTGDGTSYAWTITDATYYIFQVDMSAIAWEITNNITNYDSTDRSHKYTSQRAAPAYSSWVDDYIQEGDSGSWDGIFRVRCSTNCSGANATAKLASLNAQNREVGIRNHGIDFAGKDYITVDGIDVYGPGAPTSGNDKIRSLVGSGSTDLIIKNVEIEFAKSAIAAYGCESLGGDPPEYDGNWLIEDVKISNSWGGIRFFLCNDFTIRRVHITGIGNKLGDEGDRPFIGTQHSDDWIIEDSYFADRGYVGDPDDVIDSGISAVNGSEGWIIRRNYIKDSAVGCLQFGNVGECDTAHSYPGTPCDGDLGNYQIYNNIFENCNIGDRTPADLNPSKKFTSVYVGAGNAEFDQMGSFYFVNNLLIGSGDDQSIALTAEATQNNSAALYMIRDYTDITIENNDFLDNVQVAGNLYEFYYSPGAVSGTKTIKNNNFYGSGINGEIILHIGDKEDVTEFNADHAYASGNIDPPVDSNRNADHTLSDTSPASIKSGGIDQAGDVIGANDSGDVDDGLKPTRVWTPFASMDLSTIERDTEYPIGPYDIALSVSNRLPSNGQTGVNQDFDITWANPVLAITIDVRFACGDETPPIVLDDEANTTESYDPGTLNDLSTCYWSIDVNHAGGTETGVIWSFKTAPGPEPVVPTESQGRVKFNSAAGRMKYDADAGRTR